MKRVALLTAALLLGLATPALGAPGEATSTPLYASVQVPPQNPWQATVAVTTTTDVAMKASAGAGFRNYLSGVTVSNTGVAKATVSVRDGTTVVWQAVVGPDLTVSATFPSPIRGTAATALNGYCSVACTIQVSAQGFVAP